MLAQWESKLAQWEVIDHTLVTVEIHVNLNDEVMTAVKKVTSFRHNSMHCIIGNYDCDESGIYLGKHFTYMKNCIGI